MIFASTRKNAWETRVTIRRFSFYGSDSILSWYSPAIGWRLRPFDLWCMFVVMGARQWGLAPLCSLGGRSIGSARLAAVACRGVGRECQNKDGPCSVKMPSSSPPPPPHLRWDLYQCLCVFPSPMPSHSYFRDFWRGSGVSFRSVSILAHFCPRRVRDARSLYPLSKSQTCAKLNYKKKIAFPIKAKFWPLNRAQVDDPLFVPMLRVRNVLEYTPTLQNNHKNTLLIFLLHLRDIFWVSKVFQSFFCKLIFLTLSGEKKIAAESFVRASTFSAHRI